MPVLAAVHSARCYFTGEGSVGRRFSTGGEPWRPGADAAEGRTRIAADACGSRGRSDAGRGWIFALERRGCSVNQPKRLTLCSVEYVSPSSSFHVIVRRMAPATPAYISVGQVKSSPGRRLGVESPCSCGAFRVSDFPRDGLAVGWVGHAAIRAAL